MNTLYGIRNVGARMLIITTMVHFLTYWLLVMTVINDKLVRCNHKNFEGIRFIGMGNYKIRTSDSIRNMTGINILVNVTIVRLKNLTPPPRINSLQEFQI